MDTLNQTKFPTNKPNKTTILLSFLIAGNFFMISNTALWGVVISNPEVSKCKREMKDVNIESIQTLDLPIDLLKIISQNKEYLWNIIDIKIDCWWYSFAIPVSSTD